MTRCRLLNSGRFVSVRALNSQIRLCLFGRLINNRRFVRVRALDCYRLMRYFSLFLRNCSSLEDVSCTGLCFRRFFRFFSDLFRCSIYIFLRSDLRTSCKNRRTPVLIIESQHVVRDHTGPFAEFIPHAQLLLNTSLFFFSLFSFFFLVSYLILIGSFKYFSYLINSKI